MSVKQSKAFAEKALKDQTILEKLTVDGADPIVIAKDHGFEFNEEHIEAGQAHFESLIDAMSDEELEDIAGGCIAKDTIGIYKNIYEGGKSGFKKLFSSF